MDVPESVPLSLGGGSVVSEKDTLTPRRPAEGAATNQAFQAVPRAGADLGEAYGGLSGGNAAATIAIVEERNRLTEENESFRTHLKHFKSLDLALAELTETLLSKLRSNEIRSSGASSAVKSSPRIGISSPSRTLFAESSSPHTKQRQFEKVALEHSSWTMLPQIRLLCLPLYECIQKLFQDFHAKEAEIVELNMSISALQKSVESHLKEKFDITEKFDTCEDKNALQMKSLKNEIERAEGDSPH